MDKFVHCIFYLGLVVLGAKASDEIFKSVLEPKKSLHYIVLFAIGYGILIELLQHGFTQSRQGDILDVLANTVGALLGMFIVKRLVFKDWSLK